MSAENWVEDTYIYVTLEDGDTIKCVEYDDVIEAVKMAREESLTQIKKLKEKILFLEKRLYEGEDEMNKKDFF